LAKEYNKQTGNFHNSEISKFIGSTFQYIACETKLVDIGVGQRDRLF
jgi:hypothetical protein